MQRNNRLKEKFKIEFFNLIFERGSDSDSRNGAWRDILSWTLKDQTYVDYFIATEDWMPIARGTRPQAEIESGADYLKSVYFTKLKAQLTTFESKYKDLVHLLKKDYCSQSEIIEFWGDRLSNIMIQGVGYKTQAEISQEILADISSDEFQTDMNKCRRSVAVQFLQYFLELITFGNYKATAFTADDFYSMSRGFASQRFFDHHTKNENGVAELNFDMQKKQLAVSS